MAVALIVAAGTGERLQSDRPKALVKLAGRPLLQWSLDVLARVQAIEQLVVALPPDLVSATPPSRAPLETLGIQAPPGSLVVAGGGTRSQSVRLALGAAPAGEPVLVHDAARPLLTVELVERMLAAVGAEGVQAATAASPVTDTIKRTDDDRVVRETLARASLWSVQTPQVFRRGALEEALAVADDVLDAATDDASLVERAGGKVMVVPASRENLKVTTPLDLLVAEALLERRAAGSAAAQG
jgi:2-C-methyl-D-erythritol 4-phosphate cytidylyltransferase